MYRNKRAVIDKLLMAVLQRVSRLIREMITV